MNPPNGNYIQSDRKKPVIATISLQLTIRMARRKAACIKATSDGWADITNARVKPTDRISKRRCVSSALGVTQYVNILIIVSYSVYKL